MSEIVLVRQEAAPIAPADADAARRVLFGLVDGLGEAGRKSWRRFVNGLMRLEPGEMVEIRTARPRSGPFHRRHMALEQQVFKPFRDWLKVGAGHCDWFPGPKGGVFPVPKSIAYDQLEEDDMREFHDNTVAFLRTEHAGRTLWRHLSPAARIEMVEGLLGGFGE